MLKYEQSTLYQDKSKGNNWYVYVTVPLELRPLLKNQKQKKKSTKTTDIRIAKDRQREIERLIYLELDEANSGNHPLVEVANKLQELMFKKPYIEEFETKYPPSDWFDPVVRMNSYNGLRDEAKRLLGLGTGNKSKETYTDSAGDLITEDEYFNRIDLTIGITKPDGKNQYRKLENFQKRTGKWISSDERQDLHITKEGVVNQPHRIHIYDKDDQLIATHTKEEKDGSTYIGETQYAQSIAPTVSKLIFEFETEFAKVSSEKFAPKKRSITFSEAMDNYFNSSDFEKISRIKTQNDYRSRTEKFLQWAGNITLEDIDISICFRTGSYKI